MYIYLYTYIYIHAYIEEIIPNLMRLYIDIASIDRLFQSEYCIDIYHS